MGHYFINEDLEHNKKIIKIIIKNEDFSFITDNGVFSKKGLDFGTRTLLENLDYKNINGVSLVLLPSLTKEEKDKANKFYEEILNSIEKFHNIIVTLFIIYLINRLNLIR